ncbi:MAG: lysis protein [Pseudomonas sp.]|nr:lysis protein [Pseudomonas sp.]
MIGARAVTFVGVTSLAAGLLLGMTLQGWRLGAELAEQGEQHASQLQRISEEHAAAIAGQQQARQALEERLHVLDTNTTKELSDAHAENERLRRLYSAADDERRRLRIEVRVAQSDAIVSAAAGAGSMVDAARLELSERAGQSVWDIRAGMISDQKKLAYLQAWASEITRKVD